MGSRAEEGVRVSTKWSKRDYEMVAGVLNKVHKDNEGNGFSGHTHYILGSIEEEFIGIFSKDNSAFDVMKFREEVANVRQSSD